MGAFLRAAGAAGLIWLFACVVSASPTTDTTPSAGPVDESPSMAQGDDISFDLDACCEPTWSVSAGAVILHRSRPDAKLIIRTFGGTTQISGGEDFDFGWDAGPDLSIARRMANGDFWEVRYFNDLGADAAADYGNPVNFQLGNFGNISATDLTARYITTLHSTEINWHRPWGERCTLLAGFRWLELQDRLKYSVTFPAFDAEYNWDEHNHLYGGQIGSDFDLWRPSSRLKINAVLKAGLFGAVADNDFKLSISNAAGVDGGDRGGNAAFVGEADLTGAYLITTHVAVHAGYQLLWINNVALASDQAAAATANFTQDAIDVDGKLFYHGAMVGVDFVW
jgi:hypothetical protein